MENLHKYMCVYNEYLYLPVYKICMCDNQLAGGYMKALKRILFIYVRTALSKRLVMSVSRETYFLSGMEARAQPSPTGVMLLYAAPHPLLGPPLWRLPQLRPAYHAPFPIPIFVLVSP